MVNWNLAIRVERYVLTLLEGADGFVFYCVASCIGLGCVLMQYCRVIAYLSMKLKLDENSYSTYDLEIVAMILHWNIEDIIYMVSI